MTYICLDYSIDRFFNQPDLASALENTFPRFSNGSTNDQDSCVIYNIIYPFTIASVILQLFFIFFC